MKIVVFRSYCHGHDVNISLCVHFVLGHVYIMSTVCLSLNILFNFECRLVSKFI
jgi:hypothetical protein